jgi:hypothetical protein
MSADRAPSSFFAGGLFFSAKVCGKVAPPIFAFIKRGIKRRRSPALRAWQATYSWPFKITWGERRMAADLDRQMAQSGSRMWTE